MIRTLNNNGLLIQVNLISSLFGVLTFWMVGGSFNQH